MLGIYQREVATDGSQGTKVLQPVSRKEANRLLVIPKTGTQLTWITGGGLLHPESWAESYHICVREHDTLLGC
jgi:hypothetical protein